MTRASELANIVKLHRQWLESGNKSGKRADLSGANLDGVTLIDTDLSGALMRGASLKNADLSACKLVHTDFSDANLQGAKLVKARLLLADFTGADLQRADLSKAASPSGKELGQNKRGPRFKDSNLAHADLSECYCFASDFTGANLSSACLAGANLERANLAGNDLSKLDMSDANIGSANLENSSLCGSNFQRALLANANIRNANLMLADLREADLTSANVAHAKVDGIKYNRQTRFRGIRLEGCYGSSRFRRYAEDQDFIEEFKEAHPNHYRLWMVLTDCGRSLLRPVIWSLAFTLSFGLSYYFLGENAFEISNKNGLQWNLFTSTYYSVVTFTTLGFGDITPRTPLAAGIVMLEVIIGYVMLGILISILATKVARRS
jgi:uncharacterized protein YjbI with pentapeptide repeats